MNYNLVLYTIAHRIVHYWYELPGSRLEGWVKHLGSFVCKILRHFVSRLKGGGMVCTFTPGLEDSNHKPVLSSFFLGGGGGGA